MKPRPDATQNGDRPNEDLTQDLGVLLAVLPPPLREAISNHSEVSTLLEIVLDLGRIPEARFVGHAADLSTEPVTRADLDGVVSRLGRFGADNRAGIERTLHRISALRNRRGDVVGLTCRVGRAVFGTIDIVRDVIESGRSILLLGRPGVGKTTLLREAARVLADELGKRVIVVDTSNEIAGDGDIPHPGIGRARRMQVPTPAEQHAVMIEAVENHMPEVIVIDEIGTSAEAAAARTIAERGVQLVATAHGNTLENLLQNPTLSDLVGGISAVTLSDEEARRRGTQKTVLERKAPPTFDILVEIQAKDRLAVHRDVAEVVDRFLRDVPPRPELRLRTDEGVEIQPGDVPPATTRQDPATSAPSWPGRKDRKRRGKTVRLFSYAVSRSRMERALKKLRVPAQPTEDLAEADLLVTLKAQERRLPRKLRDAIEGGLPLHVLRSNTQTQIDNFLRELFDVAEERATEETALREVEDGIDEAIESGLPVELNPQASHLRRLQHEAIGGAGLTSQSRGEEPFRRVVVLPTPAPSRSRAN